MSHDPNSVSEGSSLPEPAVPLADVPPVASVLPLDNVVVFPFMIAPIVINDERSKVLIEDAMRSDRVVAVFHPMPGDDEEQAHADTGGNASPAHMPEVAGVPYHPIGTLCSILRMLRIPDGSVRLLLHGVCRIRLDKVMAVDPFTRASIQTIPEIEAASEDLEVEAMMKLTVDNIQRAVSMSAMPEELAVAALNVEGAGKMADLVASNLSVRPRELLPVLAEPDAKKRLQAVQRLLGREVHVMEIGSRINDEVREEVDRNQRSFFLHQQMKAIRRELGEADPHEAELEELQVRVKSTEMPAHARKAAEKEISRLQGMPTAAAEYGVIRTYLEWILDIPWNISSDDHLDIHRAREILDEDHYGLEKVKERILEFLSVIRLKGGNLKGPILCFVGPPGVGKTSLGKSIARATGRNFQNFSLGGMRDEAEIRGHRRTYVGSMPGRIIKALKEAGTNNPLIMLDEIDKLGSDFRGDPASALLEVLDPEQNYHFTDHYMDMPVDLSRVMFITTANTMDTIPDPLRDRMEIIRIAGYTDLEKLEIATRYLVPRELENTGVSRRQLTFTKPALRAIIHDYTSEAGVRGLQREISKACRKVAMRVAEHESALESKQRENGNAPKRRKKTAKPPTAGALDKVKVTPENLEDFLGKSRTYHDVAERMGRPGIAIGLAWTSIGGAILFIEAVRYPGKGELHLTGHLGDVMKESAQAALTWLKAHARHLKIDDAEFEKFNFHVHVPSGATPKDGPSAGVAIATALASLLTGRPVKDYLAMTGEITLRGNVMPVGGIKEKCLAAHRAGIRHVYLPSHNRNEFDDVPETVRRAMKVSFFDEVHDVVSRALK